tara:strand:- start:2003 stop:2605 length:603 start_codon:yes stop_codon:yes gene_type:complete
MMVSESDGDSEVDAYGAAISEPTVNNQQLNFFGDKENAKPDSLATPIVGSTGTWEVWSDLYITAPTTTTREVWAMGGQCWTISLPGSGTAVGTLNFATNDGTGSVTRVFNVADGLACHTFVLESGVISQYRNGSLIGTGVSGTVKSPLDTPIFGNSLGGSPNNGDNPFAGKLGSAKVYNTALDATDVMTNYNAQKSLYGL